MLRNEMEYISEAAAFHGCIPFVMGTRLDFLTVGTAEPDARELWTWLCLEAEKLDMMLNRFSPESELSVVNDARSAENVRISDGLAELVRAAKNYWTLTCGLFDISKGGMNEILLDDNNCISLNNNTLDFGGFAKGCLLKKVQAKLRGAGVQTAFVNFGDSSILTLGHHPFGDCWKVGVKNPFGGKVLGEMELTDKAMSTSGNTPFYSGHIINPETGEACEDRVVVTVVSDDPLDAEILSTAAVIADPEKLEDLKRNFPGASFGIWRL